MHASGRWRVAPRLLRARVAGRGPAADCDGSCCRYGAYCSLDERDRILAHARGIRHTMDTTHAPATWFERRLHRDADFPDGVAIGTRVVGGRCVFRTGDGLCAIQRYEETRALPRGVRLKPFYCRLFPVTTDGCRLDYDPLVAGRRPCCTLSPRGDTPAWKAWATELRLVLGVQGWRRLRDVATRQRRRGRP